MKYSHLPPVGEKFQVTLTLEVSQLENVHYDGHYPIEVSVPALDGVSTWLTEEQFLSLLDPEYKRKQLTAQIEELQKTLAELDNVKGETNEN